MDLISRKSVAKKMLYRRDYVGRPSDPDCIIADEPSIPAVPLDKLCNTLSGLYEVLPCWECEKVLGEEYCQEKECGCGSIGHWKSYFEKKMEGLDAAD